MQAGAMLLVAHQAMQTCCLTMNKLQVFETWVRAVNSRMASKRKSILILMDNASSHAIPSVATEKIHGLDSIKLSHVLIVFLPPNTTSKVQFLDAGIIVAFKQHYRGHLLRWYLNEYEQASQDTNLSKLMPGVRQAILWSVAALEHITDQTIRNCWRKTGILPPTMSAEIVNSDKARDVSAAAELSRMISGLNLGDDALSADEFGELPSEQEVEADLTDDQLLDLLDDSSGPAEPIEEDDESGDIEDHVPAPSLLVARQQLKGLATFMADNPQFTTKDEMSLQATIDKVARMVVARVNHQKQQSISTYFTTV